MAEFGSPLDIRALDLIRQLNETDEHSRLEAKTSSRMGKSILETACAYANEPSLGGGYLLLGVAKDEDSLWPTYDVRNIENPDQLQQDIASQCATNFNRPIRPQFKIETVRGATVMIVFIPEASDSEKPIHFSRDGLPRGAWRRIGSTDQRCSEDDMVVFYSAHDVDSFDRQIVNDTTIDDIDPNALRQYRSDREKKDKDAVELSWTDDELLLALNCVRRKGEELVPTVAGILLLGTQQALRRCFPMMRIDYIRVPGDKWVEDPASRFQTIPILEPLVRAVGKAQNAILDEIPKAFSIPEGSMQRVDTPALPPDAIREVVVNAVMHRSYKTHGPVQIIRYANRIEIRNPGHSLVSDDRLGEPGSETRNPFIAAALYDLGHAETKGSGIRAVRALMKGVGLSPPVLESDRGGNRFTAYLLLHHFLSKEDLDWLSRFQEHSLTDSEQLALIFAREAGAVDNSSFRNLNQVDTLTASGHLRRLRNLGLLESKGKSAKTYYVLSDICLEPALIPDGVGGLTGRVEDLTGGVRALSGGVEKLADPDSDDYDELPVATSKYIEKNGKRAPKDRMKKSVLLLCEWKPLSTREIMQHLNRKMSGDAFERLVKPLVVERYLELTIPDSPFHRDQKYTISSKGSAYLISTED